MEKEQEIVKVNSRLEGITATRFLQIKELKGLHNNTEVVRSLINDWWNEHPQEGHRAKREP